ncbi:MAG: hypothetical protein ABFS12_02900 [Bacteroidota bacterium]
MKKNVLFMLFSFVFVTIGCSDDCEEQNPTVKLVNNGTDVADIQIKTSGGNTENINNIEPGTSSERRSFAPGTIEFTIDIKGVTEQIEYSFTVVYCNDYTVTINENNQVSHDGVPIKKTAIPNSL